MFKMIYNTLISFLSFYEELGDGIQSIKGVMLRG
jgi:hypothetical protein